MRIARWCWLIIVAAGCRDNAPAAMEAVHLEYQVTEQHLARNTNEVRMYGLDLNGDKTADNQLGMVLAALLGQDLANPQASTDAALAAGTLQMTIELATTDPTFSGSAHVAVGTGTDRALIGDGAAAAVTAGPGDATLVIAPFGTPCRPCWSPRLPRRYPR